METDNQNQQSFPSSPAQPTITPASSGGHKKIWLTLIIVIAFVAMGIGGYILGTNRKLNNSTSNQLPVENASISPTISQANNPIIGLVSKIAFIRNYNLWISNNGAEKQITTDGYATQSNPKISNAYPSISPDGNKIAYFRINTTPGNQSTSLYIVNVDGTGMKSLIENGDFERTYPVQWFNDNQNILIETYSHTGDANALMKVNIANGNKQQLTSYNIQSGCGGGSSDPSFGLSGSEGARPVYSKIFQLSSDNSYLIHNTTCTGYGVNIYNLQTNQDKPLSDSITQAIFSPDGTEVAGIARNNQILLFDVKTATSIKTLTTSIQPEVLYWFQDNRTIYYGADIFVKNLTVKDSLGNSLEGVQNQANLWSISTDGTNNKKLQDFDAYDIKPLYIDSNKAVVVRIDNPTKYFDAINQDNKNDGSNALPTVNVATISLSTGNIENTIQNASESMYSSK